VRKFIAIGLGIFFLVVFIASWTPLPIEVELIEPDADGNWGRPVEILYPARLRQGETGWLTASILPDESRQDEADVIEARLDLPGLSPAVESSGQVVGSKNRAQFRWMLDAREVGKYEGRLWIYAGTNQVPVIARSVSVVVGPVDILLVWAVRGTVLLGLGGCIWDLKSVIKSNYSDFLR